MVGETYEDEHTIISKYDILPSISEWKEKIVFLETRELTPTPEKLEQMLLEFKKRNILQNVKGLIVGKPKD